MSYPRSARKPASRARLALEPLEDRTVPYTLTGYKWANLNVSASVVPDGTLANNTPSTLFAVYDPKYPTATWQREFARALQTWASVTPLNFRFVADGGQPGGTVGLAQGDSRFGDIRLGARPLGSPLANGFYPSTTSTMGGDVTLNSGNSYNIGTRTDLYSVLVHETGHALGLGHSYATQAVMRSSITTVYTGLYADDIAGIQAIYGPRKADAFDAQAANDTPATATPLTVANGAAAVTADLTTLADIDHYRLAVPAGSDGTATVSVDARGLSLLAPKVSVYTAAGQLVATATAGAAYGTVATVTLKGLTAGQSYTVVADGATADVFGMGGYRLAVQFGGYAVAQSFVSSSSSGPTTTTTQATGSGALLDDCDECHNHADEEARQGPRAAVWQLEPAAAVRAASALTPPAAHDHWQDSFVIPVDVDQPPPRPAVVGLATAVHEAPHGESALGFATDGLERP